MMERTTEQGAALAAGLRDVMRQTQALMDALAQDRKEAMMVMRDRIAIAVGEATSRLDELRESAQRLHKRTQARATEFGRENPWTVVAVAGALGLLIGAAAAPRKV